MTAAKHANTGASSVSILANRPVAVAQFRTRQGFAAITAVFTSACSRGRSKPPVASITMSDGPTWLNCEISVVILALARG